MLNRAWLPFLTTACMVALVGCSGRAEEPTGPETASAIPSGAAAVSYEIIDEVSTSNSAILDRRRLVIRDAETWAAFWSDFVGLREPKPPAPDVDFGARMVIAATMGERSSGGYSIGVPEVAEMEGLLYALVREVAPGIECAVTTALTAPAVAVSVPRHEGSVAFVDEELALPCAP